MALWLVGWSALAGIQLGARAVPGGTRPLGSPELLFVFVIVAAGLCVLTSAAVVWRAWRDDTAELGFHGAFFMAVSALPLVHGITTPGVLYGPNNATMTAVLWGLPLACVAQLPILLGRRLGASLVHRWKPWVVAHLAIQGFVAVGLLVSPAALPLFDMGTGGAIVVTVGALLASLALSARHLRLHWVSRAPATLAVSLAYAAIGASHLVWINGAAMTLGFWVAHVLDIVGVFLATIVGYIAYRRNELEQLVLKPLVASDPLDALEIGLDPVVRAFVADLERKDEITAVHVIRTAETAMAVGRRLRLEGHELRILGMGALLHDIGKIEIDDAILNKPGRLTHAEFEHVKTHTLIGERLAAESRVLGPVQPLIRSHHERIDGRGYPDRLRGDEIPRLARIVSVCDAYDAMVHTRQYREGMGADRAIAILREHAGSQWDATVVEALIRAVMRGEVPDEPTVLADAGHQVGCSCTHEIPMLVGGTGGVDQPNA